MAETWEHPELGSFKWNGDRWVGRVEVPAWSVYKHYPEGGGLGEYVENEQTVPVEIEREEAGDGPSEAQVAALLGFVQHSPKLASAVVETVWAVFSGDMKGSGYWWEGDLDQVNEAAEYNEDAKPIESQADVRDSLLLMSIGIGYQHETAIEISFSPWWEEEHGVGVLVHEDRVLGIGYQLDVEPFDKSEPSWPKRGDGPVINPFTGKPLDPKAK